MLSRYLHVFTVLLLSLLSRLSFAVEKDSIPTVKLEVERELRLKGPVKEGERTFISAASGLIRKGDQFFVVSDDELSLYYFQKSDPTLSSAPLIEGTLPMDKDERKKLKPDFESAVLLSETQWPPHGAIVAWPSGSTHKRLTAVTVPFEADGKFGKPLKSDIRPLSKILKTKHSDLNVEGILISGQKVSLYHRGNAKTPDNHVFEIPLNNWLTGLKTGQWKTDFSFQKLKLGKLKGISLTLTDVVSTKHGILGLAAAEDNISSYSDGTIYGSVLVRIKDHEAKVLAKFSPVAKLEGIAIKEEHSDGSISLYLVDDADDSVKPSRLFTATISKTLLNP